MQISGRKYTSITILEFIYRFDIARQQQVEGRCVAVKCGQPALRHQFARAICFFAEWYTHAKRYTIWLCCIAWPQFLQNHRKICLNSVEFLVRPFLCIYYFCGVIAIFSLFVLLKRRRDLFKLEAVAQLEEML